MKKWLAGVAGAAVVVLAGLPAPSGAATALTLTRAPYVTDLTTTGAYIDWAIAGQQTAGSVMVLPAAGGTCPSSIPWNAGQAITSPTVDPLVQGSSTTVSWTVTVGTTAEYQVETPVTGLQPATRYCYAVYSSHTSSAQELWPVQTFTTLAAAGSTAPVTFAVIGDTGENLSKAGVPYPNFLNTGQQALYQEIGNSGAQFLLAAGDVSYSGGTETSYGDLNQTGTTANPDVSDIFGPQYEPQMRGIPTFVADGNHGQTSDDLRIWPQPATVAASNGMYSYGPPPAQVDGITSNSPSDWYAIQDGQVRVYVLDAAWGDTHTGTATGSLCQPVTTDCKQYQADADEHWQAGSTEYQWLQHDLAVHPGGVKMAVFHYPLRSLNSTQPTDPYLSGLEALLSKSGVQVAFNGHAHTYQRIQPKASGTVSNFVTGGGGGILEPVDGNGDTHGAVCRHEIRRHRLCDWMEPDLERGIVVQQQPGGDPNLRDAGVQLPEGDGQRRSGDRRGRQRSGRDLRHGDVQLRRHGGQPAALNSDRTGHYVGDVERRRPLVESFDRQRRGGRV